MALRPCLGCGRLVSGSRCGNCQPAQRSTAERGYGSPHQAERARWKPVVEAGQAFCHAAICLLPSRQIQPGSAWDMGHNPQRTAWTGPEHERCNRSDGGIRGNRNRRKRWTTSRQW